VRAGLVALLAMGCSPSLVEVHWGDLTVRVEPDPARIFVAQSGHAILDASRFETRFARAEWTELFGSFTVDEVGTTAWRSVGAFDSLRAHADTIDFSVGKARGQIRRDGDAGIEVLLDGFDARTRASFRCAPGEHFAGFGAMPMDVDERGQKVALWTSEQGIGRVDSDEPAPDWFYRGTRHQSYFPSPFFVSSAGYGFELDGDERAIFDLCSDGKSWQTEVWGSKLDFHLYRGPKPVDVLANRGQIVGHAALPPAFAFAPWNDAIFGSAEVRQIAAELRANHIPSSVIWTEDWAGGEMSGDSYSLTYRWAVDRTLYPDAEKVASELHAAGFKWLAYFNTFAESDGDHFDSQYLIQKDGATYTFDSARFKPASLVDLSSQAARDWMAGFMARALDLGFDGWMADYGEWLPVDATLSTGASSEPLHNQYPNEWHKLNERVLDERNDGVERLVFVRSGFGATPIARRHQVVWGGDQLTEFDAGDGLPSAVTIGINYGLSGLPWYGSDVGGYTSPPNHAYTTKELFFRWATFGALSPILRTHHGTAPRNEWRFDSDQETLAHWARWARLHMQLYPYLRAAAEEAAATGVPLMRAVALAFPDEDAAWAQKDEYLLGPSLLVAPVVTMGATGRDVYFPNARWLPLFGGAAVQGGGTMTVSAPLTEIPVFARAGTILVLLPASTDTLVGALPTAREVWAYAGAAGAFTDPTSGAAYAISDGDAASGALTWNGAALAGCGNLSQAPCGDRAASSVTAHVVGPGTLAVGGAALTLPSGEVVLTVRF
jgi:alpha-glucosidase (family GH31 glycosyl hydrolase)